MYKMILILSAATLANVAVVGEASISHHSTFTLSGPLGNPTSEVDYINSLLSTTYVYLDKLDGGRKGDGILGIDGTITGSTGSSTSVVDWDLTGTDYGVFAILVKDGNLNSNQAGNYPDLDPGHLYSLYTVSNTLLDDQTKVGGGTVGFPWLGDYVNKDISHITLVGQTEPDITTTGNSLPEPTALVVWSLLTIVAGSSVSLRSRN